MRMVNSRALVAVVLRGLFFLYHLEVKAFLASLVLEVDGSPNSKNDCDNSSHVGCYIACCPIPFFANRENHPGYIHKGVKGNGNPQTVVPFHVHPAV